MDVLMVCYGIIMNLLAFLLYGIDKWSARHNLRRIPEKVLLGIAAIGGSLGAFAGMRLFRHKTRKTKFYLGVPILLFLQICVVVVVMTFL
jgi:uncharacterized membrane protein YsdA (DUF1294 family)